MKFQVATAAALFAGMLPSVSAHYFFDGLVVNGQKSTEFVRENTRQTKYMPTKFIKTFDNLTPLDTDFRCNLGATANAARGTAQIKAGDSLAMTLGVGATMRHPGPAQVYMSKAPSTAAAYDGSGGWFKIHQETICNPSGNIKEDAWCTWDKDRVSFKVPAEIEDGEYLIRAEHIGLHGAHGGEAEFYYGCAQVSVSGGAGSAPASTVKIPGMYQKADPEVSIPFREQKVMLANFSRSTSPSGVPTRTTRPRDLALPLRPSALPVLHQTLAITQLSARRILVLMRTKVLAALSLAAMRAISRTNLAKLAIRAMHDKLYASLLVEGLMSKMERSSVF